LPIGQRVSNHLPHKNARKNWYAKKAQGDNGNSTKCTVHGFELAIANGLLFWQLSRRICAWRNTWTRQEKGISQKIQAQMRLEFLVSQKYIPF
jgi:hypothetical protein